ncbi:hypothetical protein ACFV4N_08045 [Actinosynnema sp. NPDC059797]
MVVAHSVTALQRLLDVTALFASDQRVQTVFTQAPAVFTAGVRPLLESLRVVVIPWQQAVETRFDVALASGYTGLADLQAPIVTLPHGAGYNKYVTRASRETRSAPLAVYGLSEQHLVRDGRVVPNTLVLSHEAEIDMLKEHCPVALPTAVVAGDPCFDRLAPGVAQRVEYRRRLGVEDGQELLVVSSTWGPDSLYGASGHVLDLAVREASANGTAVVLLLHPNVWFGHSPWQVEAWCRPYREAGLHLVPPFADWRSHLLCADRFIGDHGSVSLYAAALGIPQLRTEFPPEALAPGSAMEILHRTVPVVRPDDPLSEQFAEVVRERSPRTSAVEFITSRPGASAAVLRTVIYGHMALDEPDGPARFDPVPAPAGCFAR